VAHNLGLAACFGGLLFGKTALNPSLGAIDSEADRGKILNTAWNRYNIINVASFATAAATWFPGRLGLSGKEIDQQTRNLVLAKDVLFAVGALSGLASVIQGRALTGQGGWTSEVGEPAWEREHIGHRRHPRHNDDPLHEGDQVGTL
jgi:hypothetical protein